MGFRKGTGFTNLNKVMTANRGNRLGSAVAGGISTQNQGVNTGIKTSQQKFEEEAQKNRLDTDEAKNKREEILGRFNQPGQLVPSSGVSGVPGAAGTSPAPANPAGLERTVFASSGGQPNQALNPSQPAQSTYQSPVSEQEISDFTKYRTGTYAGPKELRDAGALYSRAQQAEQSGALSQSAGGRQELLKRFVGHGDYNQGQRQLDESLLGQDANGVRAAARQTRGATNRVEQANQNAGNLAQEYTGRAKIFGDETGKRIGETKSPLSSGVDTRVTEAQNLENQRQSQLQAMQDMFVGTGDQYEGVDKMTRLGLGLQGAMDQGYLSKQDSDFLLGKEGKTGLLARGQNLGLDVNKLLNERIKNTNAQNLGRTGIASDEEIAKLNALDRLSGKQGSDLEFLQGQGDYAKGNIGFDLKSLEDYISKTEGEKAAGDNAYADKLAFDKSRYLNQALAYGGGALGSANQAVNNMTTTPTGLTGLGVGGAAGLNAQLALNHAAARQAGVGAMENQAGAEASGALTGAEAAALPGSEAAGAQISMGMPNALGEEALGTGGTEAAGLEAGGEALGAGPAGLLAAIAMDTLTGKDTTAQTEQAAANTALGAGGAAAQGSNAILEGLLKLNLGGQSLANSPAGQQLANAIAYKSKLENQGIQQGSQVSNDYTGGLGGLTKNGIKDVTSGDYKDILNNIKNFNGTTSVNRAVGDVGKSVGNAVKKITGGGIKISDEDLKTDIDYSPKDVQNFMDRLKPASYDYKEEVQDDPRASKDRQLGVMAQDLEKSKLGKTSVHEADIGKVVDYKDLQPKMLASLAALNQRLKKMEGKE